MTKLATVLRSSFLTLTCAIALAGPVCAESPMEIVVTNGVLADMALQIGGKYVAVEIAKEAATNAEALYDADLIVVNGLGQDSWVAKQAQEAESDAGIVVASRGVKPKTQSDGATDPHAWMAPSHGKRYVNNIADAMEDWARKRARPELAQEIRINAARYLGEIDETDKLIRESLESIPNSKRVIVTGQDNLAYFAASYDMVAIPCTAPDAAETVKAYGIKRIFLDAASEPRPAMLLAADTGARLSEALRTQPTPADGPAPNYLALLKYDAAKIAKAASEIWTRDAKK